MRERQLTYPGQYGGQPLDANPFADPQNPFQQSNASAFSLESVGRATPTGGAANIGAYVADHDRRAQELEQKQRELEARERQLQQREAEVEQLKPNWPPCEYYRPACNVRARQKIAYDGSTRCCA